MKHAVQRRWEPWNSSFRRRNWEIITLYIYFHVQKTDMLTDGLVWRALSARPSKTFPETRCQGVWDAARGHARYGCQARFVSQWPLKIAIPVWLVDVTSHHVTQHRAPYSLRQVTSHNGTLGTNMAMGFLFLLLNTCMTEYAEHSHNARWELREPQRLLIRSRKTAAAWWRSQQSRALCNCRTSSSKAWQAAIATQRKMHVPSAAY